MVLIETDETRSSAFLRRIICITGCIASIIPNSCNRKGSLIATGASEQHLAARVQTGKRSLTVSPIPQQKNRNQNNGPRSARSSSHYQSTIYFLEVGLPRIEHSNLNSSGQSPIERRFAIELQNCSLVFQLSCPQMPAAKEAPDIWSTTQ